MAAGHTERRARAAPRVNPKRTLVRPAAKAAQPGRIPTQSSGTLIVIGGHEDKEKDKLILEDIARRAKRGKLVVVTLATSDPRSQWAQYRKLFRELDVRHVEQLEARDRDELLEQSESDVLDGASVVFFGGGDQLRITSTFGGTPLCEQLRELFEAGATIAGTSSGASALGELMIVAEQSDESRRSGDPPRLAAGLAFIAGVIIDQHFAERGRIGRLIAAMAQNPRMLGIGIDEDTAVVFEPGEQLRFVGHGNVYIVDGGQMTHTTAADDTDRPLSVHGMVLHLLSCNDRFDLASRTPIKAEPAGSKEKR